MLLSFRQDLHYKQMITRGQKIQQRKEHQKGTKVHTGSSSKSEGQEALSCSEKGLESRTSPQRLTTGMEHPGGSDGGSSKSSSLLTVLTSTSMFAM